MLARVRDRRDNLDERPRWRYRKPFSRDSRRGEALVKFSPGSGCVLRALFWVFVALWSVAGRQPHGGSGQVKECYERNPPNSVHIAVATVQESVCLQGKEQQSPPSPSGCGKENTAVVRGSGEKEWKTSMDEFAVPALRNLGKYPALVGQGSEVDNQHPGARQKIV